MALTNWWARLRRQPARRPNCASYRLSLEPLEARTLPATINWIAGSGNFDNGSNWSGGVVPGFNDVAVIDTASTAATITIQKGDNIQVGAIDTASADTLAITGVLRSTDPMESASYSGGALTVTTGSSTLNGPLSISGAGSLTANGSGASLTANGTTTITNGSLSANGGAQLSLPTLTTIDTENVEDTAVSLGADGAGSVLNVPALTSYTAGSYAIAYGAGAPPISGPYNGTLSVTHGGTVLYGALTQLTGVNLTLDGTGTLAIGQWTAFANAFATISGGTYTFPNLANIDGSQFTVSGGAQVSLPAVTSMAAGQFSSYGSEIDVSGGGQVSLPALTSIALGGLSADGTGSTIDVPALTTFNGTSEISLFVFQSFLRVTDGGTVLDGALTQLSNVYLTLDGTGTLAIGQWTAFTNGGTAITCGTETFTNLANIAGTGFDVSGGAQVSLPAVTSYPLTFNGGGIDMDAIGSGSTLTLGALTSIVQGGSMLNLAAKDGGWLSLPVLTTINTKSEANLEAYGTGSIVYVPALTTYNGDGGDLDVGAGGAVVDGALTNLNAVYLNIDGTGTVTIGITIAGTSPGSYGQLEVGAIFHSPSASLGSQLQVAHTAATPVGSTFVIVNGPISGTFDGIPEGAMVTASDGTQFSISYGNSGVTLTQLATIGPTISGFGPTSGPVGTAVTITGTAFTGATAVTFGNVAAAAFTVNSDAQITATVPTGATSGPIAVVTPSGTVVSTTNFTLAAPPTIAGLSPGSGPVGSSVAITGTNFSGVSAVAFNGVASNFLVVSPTQIAAIVPTGATNGSINVTTPYGSASSTASFTVTLVPPTITTVIPGSGPVGSQQTIKGANFIDVTAVTFNGVASTFTVDSPTQISATVPSGAASGSLVVTTPGGSASDYFFVSTPQSQFSITGISPIGGPVGTVVTILGSGFSGVTQVSFHGTAASAFTVVSATQITATVPIGATTGPISVSTPGAIFGGGGNFTLSTSTRIFATAPDAGGGPQVNVYDANTNNLLYSFFAYDPNFTGGVRVAVGDVNGDGIPDIITGAGPGGGSDIKIFDGSTGALIREFSPFNPLFTGGQYIAAADLNNQGYDDIIVGADYGGGPEVIVFDGKTGAILYNFFAYDPAFIGGVRVAAGDVLGNGHVDIICGAGPGGGPNVTVFQPNADGTVTPNRSFFAYDPAFTLGIYVAAGEVQGNGTDAIITGAGAGGGPNVSIFDGSDESLIASFFAYDPGFVGGVRVAAVQGSDGSVAVATVAGPGGGPQVSEFDGMNGALVDSFFAYNPLFNAGLWVAGA